MSGAHLYNRCDLEEGLMVTIRHASANRKQGFLLILTDLDSRMECGRKFFLAFADAHAYAESCFNNEETPS